MVSPERSFTDGVTENDDPTFLGDLKIIFDKVQKSVFGAKKGKQDVATIVKNELVDIEQKLALELLRFEQDYKTEKAKGKRLLFLFQKDLMPGISGQILESKDQRDDLGLNAKSQTAKSLAWLMLGLLDLSMLFYIFLFAVSQEPHR